MKRMRMICVVLTALIAFIIPDAAFAQGAPTSDPGPEWNIKIEFRYSKGQEDKLNVPGSITRYGRNYQLVSKSDPVLEKKLPATRTYTWLIDGTIPESQLHLIEDMEDVTAKPTTVEIGRVIDKVDVMTELPTNDVEALPLTKTFDEGVLTRAAVRFDSEGNDDYGLPLSYEAEVVYRGLEIYMGLGYEVSATYTTKEDLDGVPVYVVIATYAPDGLVPVAGTTGGGTGGTAGTGGAGNTGDTAPPDDEPVSPVAPPIDSEPESTAQDTDEAVIPDEQTPRYSGDDSEQAAGTKLWVVVVLVVLAAIGGFVIWMLLTRRKNLKEKEALREEKRRARMSA